MSSTRLLESDAEPRGDRNPQGHQLLALATRALQTLARQGVCALVANSTARGLSDGMDDEGSLLTRAGRPRWDPCGRRVLP